MENQQNSSQAIDFKGKIIIKLKIKLLTGLHIGAEKETAKIGGIDNPVIKDPLTEEPYIPGSSLKGKIRSLLEKAKGKIGKDEGPCNCEEENCEICSLFGSSNTGNGRLIFRDFYLTESSRKKFEKKVKEGEGFFEEKVENAINRITGTTAQARGGMRTIERVPKDTEFEGELIYNFVKRKNQDEDFLERDLKNIASGFRLLMDDYLGGSGSRGYGKVEVTVEVVEAKKKKYYFEQKNEYKKKITEPKLDNNFSLEEIKNFLANDIDRDEI